MTKRFYSRRELLQRAGGGIASLAFADLMAQGATGGALDAKPELYRHRGEALTGKGEVVVSQGNPGGLMPSPWESHKYGQCGMDVSTLFPKVAEMVDDL